MIHIILAQKFDMEDSPMKDRDLRRRDLAHLSPEEVQKLLAGEKDENAEQHLKNCPDCALQLEEAKNESPQ